MGFGRDMTRVRSVKGMTQGQLAKASGVARYLLSQIENHKALPTPEQEAAIRTALGWTERVDKGLAMIEGEA